MATEREFVKSQTCPACGEQVVGEQLPKHLDQECDAIADYRQTRGGGR